MDRSITVRYFRLDVARQGQPSFSEAVNTAIALGHSPHERQRVIAPGVTIRLERKRVSRGVILGEVVRVQTENIPPEAQANGLVPLGIGGLGHSVAFAYDEQSQVIAIQFDPRGVSLGRFLDYLNVVMDESASFSYQTIVNNNAWERYNRGQPRSISISIAAPQNLENIEGPADAVISATKRLAEMSAAPVVTIEMSMGNVQRASLAKRFIDQVVQEFTQGDSADQVRSLSVKTKEGDLPPDTIDFIHDFARDQETLDLRSDNHEENYNVRSSYIVRSLNDRIIDLRAMYAVQ